MKTRALLRALFALVGTAATCTAAILVACGEDPVAEAPTPTLRVVDAEVGPDGSVLVPYDLRGGFTVELTTDVPGLVSGPPITIELLAPTSTETRPVTTVTLVREALDASRFVARARLEYPPAGPVTLRVHGLGTVLDQPITVELPSFGATLLDGSIAGGAMARPLCIRGTPLAGELDVTLTGATFAAGGNTARLPLRPSIADPDAGCAATSPPYRSYAIAETLATGASFVVDAKLAGTEHRLASTPLETIPTGDLRLTIVQDVDGGTSTTLPDAGGAVSLRINASLANGAPPRGLVVTLEVVPDSPLLPKAVVIDEAGVGTSTLIAPAGPAVRIEATALGKRDGVTLTRAANQ